VDTHSDFHLAVSHAKQGFVGAGQYTAAHSYADRAGSVIRPARDLLSLCQRVTSISRCARDFVDHQVASDSPAQVDGLRAGGCDVVGHDDCPAVHADAAQALTGQVKVQAVACVIAIAEQHARAGFQGKAGDVDLLGRRRRKDFADDRTAEHAWSDQAHERWVVPGTASPDDRYLPFPDTAAPHDRRGSGNYLDQTPVGGNEPSERVGPKGRRIIDENCHQRPPLQKASRRTQVSAKFT
jgi:hypothetical protein